MRHYQAVVGIHAIFSLDKNAFSDPSRANIVDSRGTRSAPASPLAFIRYWSEIYSPDRIQDYTPRDLYIAGGAHVANVCGYDPDATSAFLFAFFTR